MDFCTCKKEVPGPLTLAMATIPAQAWEAPCDPAAALKQGTVFPSLIMPFYAAGEKLGGESHG